MPSVLHSSDEWYSVAVVLFLLVAGQEYERKHRRELSKDHWRRSGQGVGHEPQPLLLKALAKVRKKSGDAVRRSSNSIPENADHNSTGALNTHNARTTITQNTSTS